MDCKCVLQLTTQEKQMEVLPGWVRIQMSECPDCQRILFAPIPDSFDGEKLMAAYVNALAWAWSFDLPKKEPDHD